MTLYNPEEISYTFDNGIELIESCGACPESYDVFHKGEYIAHFRLRHGRFAIWDETVGIEVYSTTDVQGDGVFEYDERDPMLSQAVEFVMTWFHIERE